MKKIYSILIGLMILSNPAFACDNKAPMSTVLFSIANNGATKDFVMDCAKLPAEECVCYDEVTEWTAAQVVDVVKDEPIYTSCQDDSVPCQREITGYNKVITGKKVIDDPIKLAAIQAQRKADDAALKAKQSKRDAAKAALKAIDLTTITTISQLKGVVKSIIESQAE